MFTNNSLDIQTVLNVISTRTGMQPRRTHTGYLVRCPAHNDHNPSLAISEADGKLLFKCFAGCDYDAICSSLNLEKKDFFPERIQLPYPKPKKNLDSKPLQTTPKKVTPYIYRDKNGTVVGWKKRIEPGFRGEPKTFVWGHPNAQGVEVSGSNGCEKLLYRIPEVMQAIELGQQIFLVEGEKDVQTLFKLGLIATTAPTPKWYEEHTQLLANADVVLLYDYDNAGVKRRDMIIGLLRDRVKRLRVVDLPGLEFTESHGKDVTDWLEMDNTVEILKSLVEATVPIKPLKSIIRQLDLDEFIGTDLPPQEVWLHPFLHKQGLVMLVARPGVGKTHMALGIAYAVATGGSFLKWHAPAPKKVLYIDGEMSGPVLQARLRKIIASSPKRHEPGFFTVITPDTQDSLLPNLSLRSGRESLKSNIDPVDLIILDNLSCLFRSGEENESQSWNEAAEWLLDLRRQGKTVILVHHAGKNGTPRGTSKKEDILDCIINLTSPEGYKPDWGACFEIRFDKARHFWGSDAAPFQVSLTTDGNRYHWEILNDPEVDATNQVAALKSAGYTTQAIIEKTGMPKLQVERLAKKSDRP